MSREVLLNVSSSRIELLEATTIQTSAIRIDGEAGNNAACQLAPGDAAPRPRNPGTGDARRSREVAGVWRAMASARGG